ncbi:MAG: pirin family protein [Weeksellaceae bacterium]
MQSNVGLVIEEKAADIGNFLVGRLLPFREKRAVGPFVFIDHMGPTCMSEYQNLDVPPHPHIGLSTLTYLLEGSIFHRDSLGNAIEIKPGEVNWMTAGKGVVHSERTPEYLRNSPQFLHGFQIWIGLPKELEQSEPSFYHIGKSEIPEWEEDGVQYKLIAGEIIGKKSPVPVHSPLYFLEIKTKEAQKINIGEFLFGEVGMYVMNGTVIIDGQEFGTKQLLIAKNATLCEFETTGETSLYIFGGEPFEDERFMFWNFVNSDREVLEEAKLNWYEQNHDAFPTIPGDDAEYVPLPRSRFDIKRDNENAKK